MDNMMGILLWATYRLSQKERNPWRAQSQHPRSSAVIQ